MHPTYEPSRSYALIALILIGVGCGNSAPTKGRIPPAVMKHDGTIDVDRVPDYVVALGRDGKAVGYVHKSDALPATKPAKLKNVEVVAEDLKSVVGHMVPGRGFVPLADESNRHKE